MHILELETPAVVVDLEAMERNISSMAEYCRSHGFGLRPHTKTHKTPEIARMQVEAGSHGITVAKAGEAEVMSAAGLEDILVHYPVLGDSKLDRLAHLARDRKIILALDSVVTAEAVSRAAARAGSTIHLLVEFDSGMRRCGVATPDLAEALAQQIAKLPAVKFAGISTYPGHIWDEPSHQGPAVAELAAKFQAVIDRLRRSGFECEIVSAGSTPAARSSHLASQLTEIRPGTYVFNDRNTMGVGACTLADVALRVLVTVVSTAVPGRAIVDGGSKTFSSDKWISGTKEGYGLVVEHPNVEFITMSEEHGTLELGDSGYSPKVGDRLTIVPNHVCACVNLHDQLQFHRAGTVEGAWQVAGRGTVR
ncbi:MAG: D-TA family PLP-dependent enzyme [Bryobacteraceae bacterium]